MAREYYWLLWGLMDIALWKPMKVGIGWCKLDVGGRAFLLWEDSRVFEHKFDVRTILWCV